MKITNSTTHPTSPPPLPNTPINTNIQSTGKLRALIKVENKSPLLNSLRTSLQPDAQGKVLFEELHFRMFSILLQQRSPKAEQTFQQIVASLLGHGDPPIMLEDALELALQELSSLGLLGQHETQGFQQTLLSLSDGIRENLASRGSNPFLSIEEALAHAEQEAWFIQGARSIASGESFFEWVSMRMPLPVAALQSHSLTGFKWEPKTSNQGILEVTLPTGLTNNIEAVALFRALPANDKNLIEFGALSKTPNESGQLHAQFRHSGEHYPQSMQFVALLESGKLLSIPIENSRTAFKL